MHVNETEAMSGSTDSVHLKIHAFFIRYKNYILN